MAESFIQVPPDSTGKKLRTRQRTIGANTIEEQFLIRQNLRVVAAKPSIATFRTLGNAATSQNLFTIENGAGSSVLVVLQNLLLQVDYTAVLTAVGCQAKVSRPTALPTAGTTLTKIDWDTTNTSNASVICRGATASDGGAATAITATAGSIAWQRFVGRVHTAVGQVLPEPINLLPSMADLDEELFLLRAGEALLVQITNPTAGNNPATNHYIVNASWLEFTLP